MAPQAQKLNKNFFALIISLFLVGCGNSNRPASHTSFVIPEQYLDKDGPGVSINSKGQIIYENQPFSGYLASYYDSLKLKNRVPVYQGRKEGLSLSWYRNGDTLMIRNYWHGEKHGEHLAWYPNGNLKFQYFFEEGLSIGNHKTWYEDGGLCQDLNYKDGYEFGSQKMYRRDGKLRSNYVVRENGRKYGLVGLKRCAKLDGETGDFDPYKGIE